MLTRSLARWLASGITMLLAAGVLAQEEDPREAEAQKECLAGNARRGIELLAQLYVETSNPNFIYNQGRCYEQNGKMDEAILSFREYLRKLGTPTAEEKADVERHIAECDATKAAQSKRAGAGPGGQAPMAAPAERCFPTGTTWRTRTS